MKSLVSHKTGDAAGFKVVNVCMVVHQYYDQDARVIRYAEALADLGICVDILGVRKSGQPQRRAKDNIRVYEIPLSREGKFQANYFVQYTLAVLLFTLWLLRLHLQRRYKVIHVHNMPDFLIFSALIPRLLGARLILDIHDPMPEFFMSKYNETRQNSRLVKLMRWQERLSARIAQAVITANTSFKNNLIQRGIPSQKITVVNNIADPKIFDPARHQRHPGHEGRFILLYPGTIAPRYGLDVAIRALPALIPDIPGICLRIIGPHNAHADELRQLSQQQGVADYVEILPAIPLEAVPVEMLTATVGIYTALPDPHMEIATPSKTLEYAAMRLPMVASRLKAVEVIFTEDEVVFFPPGDSDAFAQCILNLYRHPEKRQEMIKSMDAGITQKHTWNRELQAYLQVLNDILPQHLQIHTAK